MDFFAQPFGILLKYISDFLAFGNYGLTIIFFTIFVKILLFPLTLKQQLSTIRTQSIQPELDALNQAYANDRQTLMQEQQKLYQKYNVNPMAGCLPTLIMFPVIIIVYNIIRSPLTYIAGLSSEVVTRLSEIMDSTAKTVDQLKVNSYFLNNPEAITEEVKTLIGDHSFVNMKFLGLDLGTAPFSCFTEKSWALAPLLIIPLLVLATQYIVQWYSSPTRGKKKNKNSDPTSRTMNLMLKLMPLLTFGIAISTPAGLGFYWTVSNLLTLLQTFLINTFFIKRNEKEV